MLKPKPTQRLGNTAGGIDELKGMAWFESLDWTKMLAKQVRAAALIPVSSFHMREIRAVQLPAPFIPEIKGSTDLQYFHPEGAPPRLRRICARSSYTACGLTRSVFADGHHITDREEGDQYQGDGAWFEDF